MRPQRCLLWAVLLHSTVAAAAPVSSAVRWQSNLDEARKLAEKTDRLVLVHFWSEACPPCMRMEREVFTQRDVATAIDAEYVAVRVNVQQSPSTAKRFGVVSWPTDLVLSAREEVIDKHVGFLTPPQYKAKLHLIASTAKTRSVQALAHIPGNSPAAVAPPQTVRGRAPEPPATRDQSGLAYAQSPQEPRGYATPPWQQEQSMPPQSAGKGEPTVNSSGTSAPILPNPTHLYPGAKPSSAPTSSSAPSAVASRNPPPTGVSGRPSVSPSSGSNAARSVASNPPLALDGYCAVTLGEKERWVRGNPRFGVIHRGRTYLFAGSDEARKFYDTPDRYAPAASGNDVVALAEQGQTVPGRREHGAWFDGRMYLFANEASYEKFSRDPSRYLDADTGEKGSGKQDPRSAAAPPKDSGGPAANDLRSGQTTRTEGAESGISRWTTGPRY